MSVKVEKTENKNEVKLSFVVEAEKFIDGIKKVYNKNAKYFSVPGFRKGKVPMNIVERQYGPSIFYEDAFNEIVPDIYDEAVKENNLEVVSRPDIKIEQMEKGKDLIFSATVQTKPEVKLGDYKGISIEKVNYDVTEESIQNELNQMLDRNSRLVSITDRAAKKGDTVVIDFDGTVDGEHFEGGKAENYDLELGSNSFIKGFEDQVVGMKINESKDIKVKFPEDYFSKDLAGKDAVFAVTVHEIKEKQVPALDDEFAKDVSEFDTLKELKDDIKAKQEKANESKAKNEIEGKAIETVCNNATIDIPSGMIDLELDQMAEDMDRRLSYQGFSLEQYLKMVNKTMDDFKTENKDEAEKSVRTRLVLEAIFNDAKLTIEDKEIDEKVAELAKAYGRKEEDLKSNEVLLDNIKIGLQSEKAVDYIVSNAKMVDAKKESKVAEIVNKDVDATGARVAKPKK